VLTELILENTLASYDPEEVVALLSCFVFQEKTENEPALTPKLEQGRDSIVAISDRIEAVQTARKVAAQEFRMLKFGIMEVVYEWAKGMVSFVLAGARGYMLMPFHIYSRSSKSPASRMWRKVLSFASLLAWTRLVGRFEMRRES
jgi:hypothetical protein